MDKYFKYQRSSLNIIILNVRRNLLFSKIIDDLLRVSWKEFHIPTV